MPLPYNKTLDDFPKSAGAVASAALVAKNPKTVRGGKNRSIRRGGVKTRRKGKKTVSKGRGRPKGSKNKKK